MSIERRNEEDNQAVIEKLRAVIYEESQKTESEKDIDLIKECVDYLMELENLEDLTQEQFEAAKAKLFSLDEQKQKGFGNVNKRPRLKGLLVAACLVIMLLVANFTAMACGINTIEILKEFGYKIVEMFTGEKEDFEGITIVKDSGSENYNSIEEFINKENLEILFPGKLPEDIEILFINIADYFGNDGRVDENYKEITFVTDSPEISILVKTSPNANKDFLTNNNFELEVINNIDCYILYENAFVQCNFIYNNFIYTINTPTIDELLIIINNLKEIKSDES